MTMDTSKMLRLPRKLQLILLKKTAKVLRLPHKTIFDTLQNTSDCHEVPRLPREAKQHDVWNLTKNDPFLHYTALTIGTVANGPHANGCGRLRTVRQRRANTPSTPRPPEWNGNPCYAFGKNCPWASGGWHWEGGAWRGDRGNIAEGPEKNRKGDEVFDASSGWSGCRPGHKIEGTRAAEIAITIVIDLNEDTAQDKTVDNDVGCSMNGCNPVYLCLGMDCTWQSTPRLQGREHSVCAWVARRQLAALGCGNFAPPCVRAWAYRIQLQWTSVLLAALGEPTIDSRPGSPQLKFRRVTEEWFQ